MRNLLGKPVGLKVVGTALVLAVLIISILLLRARPGPEVGEPESQRGSGSDSTAYQAGPASGPAAAARPAADGSAGADDEFEVVFFAPWGSGAGQLGRREAEESDPAGPMGFVVDEAGRAAVLDQVNSRVAVYAGGKQVKEVGLPADTYQDLRLDRDGNLVLMDRLARRSVEILDPEGKRITRVELEGAGISEGGGTTGLFLREDGIWVEVEHTRLVRVADSQGRPDPDRPQVDGRFSADGVWLLSAAREGRDQAVILVRPAAAPGELPRLFSRVRFPLPVLQLVALESDLAGRVLLAAHLARFETEAPFGVLEERLEAVLLGPEGAEIDRVRLPAPQEALDQFRTLLLTPDGVLYHLYYDESGVSLRRVAL